MYGALLVGIPFLNHNHAIRMVFTQAQGKAAIAECAKNMDVQFETSMYLSLYPDIPIVSTKIADLFRLNDLPGSFNAVVAILSRKTNQEDAIEANKRSIDLGMARILIMRTYYEVAKIQGNQTEHIQKPNPNTTIDMSYTANYSKLDEDGLISPGVNVTTNDIVIGKTTPLTKSEITGGNVSAIASKTLKQAIASGQAEKDRSGVHRAKESSIIDQSILFQTIDGSRAVKCRSRRQNVPDIGDKFSSRHGQKGTIGDKKNPEDLPSTFQGVTPDFFINSHSISRCTLSHFLETIAGRCVAETGEDIDGTAFETKIDHSLLSYRKLKIKLAKKRKELDEIKQKWSKLFGSAYPNKKDADQIILIRGVKQLELQGKLEEFKYVFTNNQSLAEDVFRNPQFIQKNQLLMDELFLLIQKSDLIKVERNLSSEIKKIFIAIKFLEKNVYDHKNENGEWKSSLKSRIKKLRYEVFKLERKLPEKKYEQKISGLLEIEFPNVKKSLDEIHLENLKQELHELEVEWRTRLNKPIQAHIADLLQSKGLARNGNEVMYDGITGEPLQTTVFSGVISYTVLRHLVYLKEHARDKGPSYAYTHQPLEGRQKNGAFRLGEMEFGCLLVNGASYVLQQLHLNQCDKTYIWICTVCKMIGYFDKLLNVAKCHCCKKGIMEKNSNFLCLQTIDHGMYFYGSLTFDYCKRNSKKWYLE